MSSSPEQIAEALALAIAERLERRLDECGAEWEQRLREDVSVPVQRQGSKVIRSKPGEKPRKDRGAYAASIYHTTQRSGTRASTTITTAQQDIGTFLEGGTENMAARPHFGPLAREVAAEFVQKVFS